MQSDDAATPSKTCASIPIPVTPVPLQVFEMKKRKVEERERNVSVRVKNRPQALAEINLDGRKTRTPFADALRLAIMRTKGDKIQLARVAEALVRKAARGDIAAIKEIADRLDGKAVQAVNLGGPNGEAIPTGIAVMFVGGKENPSDVPVIDGEAEDA